MGAPGWLVESPTADGPPKSGKRKQERGGNGTGKEGCGEVNTPFLLATVIAGYHYREKLIDGLMASGRSGPPLSVLLSRLCASQGLCVCARCQVPLADHSGSRTLPLFGTPMQLALSY